MGNFSKQDRGDSGKRHQLAQTLQTLERDGLLVRRAYPQVPPKVEYALTESGREVAALTSALVGWVENRMPEIQQAQQRQDGRRRPA